MGGIPLAALAVQQPPSPLDQASKIMALQRGVQQQQLGAQELQQQKYNFGATQAINEAYKGAVTVDSNGQPKFDTEALTKSLSTAGYGSEVPTILKHVTDFQKSQADLQKTNTDIADTKQKMQVQQTDMLGSVGAAIKAANYDPGLADTFLQHFELNNPQSKQEVDQVRQQIQQNPGMVKQAADNWIAASPKQRELAAQEQTAGARAQGATTSAAEFQAKLPGGPLNRVQQDIQVATNPQVQAGKIAVAGAEAKARAQANAGAPATDPAVDMVGQGRMDYATATGRYPPLARQAFDKELAARYPQYNQMNYGVEKKVQQEFTSGDAAKSLTAFNTAIQHATQAQQAANALDNGDVRTLNKIGNALGVEIGSDKVTNFNAIKSALTGEVSKVFKGGQATDAEIKEVQGPLNAANSPAQLHGALDTVIHLMNSKRDALKAQYEAGKKGQPNFGGGETGGAQSHPFFSQFGGNTKQQ
jgi:hypothetical protein